jgi:hypothetical protein
MASTGFGLDLTAAVNRHVRRPEDLVRQPFTIEYRVRGVHQLGSAWRQVLSIPFTGIIQVIEK